MLTLNKSPLVPVILCGGSGTRLWPLSRSSYPKQFVEFQKGQTLFKSTLKRVVGLTSIGNPIVVCNKDHRFLAKRDLDELNCHGNIIVEPVARNTAPAIALAAFEAVKSDPDAVLLVLPSDHSIEGRTAFVKAIEDSVHLAESSYLVTFGIRPTGPETGFGYIEAGDPISASSFKVKRFVEKPVLAKAKDMLEAGGYYWNSGMFVFKASSYLDALKSFAPDIFNHCRIAMENQSVQNGFIYPNSDAMNECPSDSIDYAVMEKTAKAAVLPLNVVWNDLGAWNAMHAVAEKDSDNNAQIGDSLSISCVNCYIHSTSRLVSAIGMRDVAVVETSDAVLVAPLSRVQEVKNVVAQLKETGRTEAVLPPVVHRPWGTYESIARGDHYQSKRITVNPGGALSLQLHNHRSEHLTVVDGIAEITVGEKHIICSANESVYIPVQTVHRLVNNSNAPVVLIEVQCGDYLGEDDIVRLDDIYSRN